LPIPIASAAGALAPRRASLSANGRGAFFAQADSVSKQEFIVAVDLDDRDRDARILLARRWPEPI